MNYFKKQIKKIIEFIKNNKLEAALILVILLGAAFLRLYRIADYMTFLGDEGRDALVVKRMIVDHKPTLLGPTASVGGFFLGPIYYFFMIPFLWVFKLDPVGPAVMVALFGLATIFLIYRVGKQFFDVKVGLLAAAFYAVSPLMIAYNRSSWNPNIMPFFSLLAIYSIWRVAVKKQGYYLGLIGLCLGVAFQLHYLAVFLSLVIGAYLLLFARKSARLKDYLLGVVGFLLTFSPFLLFELRHQFPNLKSLYRFVLYGKETGVAARKVVPKLAEIFFRIFSRFVTDSREPINWIIVVLSLSIFIFLLWRSRKKKISKTYFLLAVWMVVGIGLFVFYRKDVYDHYLGFLYPLPYILTALVLVKIGRLGKIGVLVASALVIWIFWANSQGIPFQFEPNRQLLQTKNVVTSIIKKAGDKPLNFALVTGHNSDHAYRYFLEVWGHEPVVIQNFEADPERKTVTDQLFVVCESQVCDPLGHSLWEIAGFGRAEIESDWKVSVIKIYKLKRWSGED
ncbi:ArnT family glycosyltransferase [Patescibacteria group bacterium]